jgi:23S rRNA pseudouridine2605 synthase
MRLNKFIAQSGVCSRRKADELILAGKVKVNDKIVKELGLVIAENTDVVKVNEERIQPEPEKIYLAVNKPVGCLSSAKTWQGESILNLIKVDQRVYPVGRLDKDSSGLLILTNDGDFAYQLTQAKFGHEKEYEVVFDRDLRPEDIKVFQSGMTIDGQKIQPVKVMKVKGNQANLILKEGINRQIRRMAKSRSYQVLSLRRIRIGRFLLGDLKEGEFKKINPSNLSS